MFELLASQIVLKSSFFFALRAPFVARRVASFRLVCTMTRTRTPNIYHTFFGASLIKCICQFISLRHTMSTDTDPSSPTHTPLTFSPPTHTPHTLTTPPPPPTRRIRAFGSRYATVDMVAESRVVLGRRVLPGVSSEAGNRRGKLKGIEQ